MNNKWDGFLVYEGLWAQWGGVAAGSGICRI